MKIAKMLLIFWVTALISMPVIAEPDEATKHFLKGQMLLTNNCGECEGASRKGLEDSLAELKLADSKGYADKVAIYRFMYKAYNDIAYYFTGDDGIEMKKYRDLAQQMAEKLIVLLPDDPDMLERYADELEDKNKQLKIWQKILLLSPKNAGTRLNVGVRLIEIGEFDQGLAQLKLSVNDADPEAKGPYMQQAIDTLNQYGHKAEADKWRREVSSQHEQKH